MEVGFDVISDLYLDPEESFNWEGKATSLYCIVAGNVSSDMRTLLQTLMHLSQFYQGVFYIPGLLEYKDAPDINARTQLILETCGKISNVACLYYNVVILDGIAILGANCWSADNLADIDTNLVRSRLDDIGYLDRSIKKLQTHLDVKKIFLVTSCVPKKDLYFGQIPKHVSDHIYPEFCLRSDTEMKVTHWAFGTYDKTVDTEIEKITYINNSYYKRKPYWPKRVGVKI